MHLFGRRKPTDEAPTPPTTSATAEDEILAIGRELLTSVELAQADPLRLFHPGSGIGQLNPSILVSKKGFDVFDKIRRDDQVRAAMSLRKGPIKSSKWELKSPEGMDTLDENGKVSERWEVTEYIDWTLRDALRRPLEDVIGGFLTCKDFGFSVSEMIFDEVVGGRWDGATTLVDVKARRPKQFIFDADPHGNLVTLIQEQNLGGRVPLPIPKFLICVNDFEWGNWYGRSEFEYIYHAWWAKHAAYKWFLMGLERFGTPPIIVGYNPGGGFTSKVLQKVKTILKNLASRTVSVIPRTVKDDLEIIIPDVGEKMAEVFTKAFPIFDRWISRGLLLPAQIGLSGDEETGSFAKAQIHFDTFLLSLEEDKRMIERIITHQLIPRIVDLQFGPQEAYPEFKFVELDNTQKIELMTSWAAMTGAGIVTKQIEDEEHVRTVHEFPEIDREQLEKTREEAKAMAEEISKGKGGGGKPFGGEEKEDEEEE